MYGQNSIFTIELLHMYSIFSSKAYDHQIKILYSTYYIIDAMPVQRVENSALGRIVLDKDCQVTVEAGLMRVRRKDGTEEDIKGTTQCREGEVIYWRNCTFEIKD
jgi:hypothetical protein